MIFVYRPAASTSAKLLAENIDGVRIRQEVNIRRRAKPTDKIVMWGAYLPNIRGVVLNNVPLQNKYEDALRLKEANVRTVEVARTRPNTTPVPAPVDPLLALWDTAQDAAEAFIAVNVTRNQVAREGIVELIGHLNRVFNAQTIPAPVAPPPAPATDWIGRTFNHTGGADLLNPQQHRPDFWAKKEAFTSEYRVHSFMGRSIRAGKKIPREGFGLAAPNTTLRVAHPWVRSYDAGWMISYADEAGIKQKHRDIAHAAVKALGLQFGAVDIGERADGTLVVLEVNRAPGVENGTIDAYTRAVRRWIDESRPAPTGQAEA